MDVRLPITAWVPYTEGHFYCGIDPNWPPSYSGGCLHFRLHEATSTEATWNNQTTRASAIFETVTGVRENCRVAFNAALVPEARDDNTLVPRSSLIYLDSIVFYVLGSQFSLKYSNNLGAIRDMAADYREQWIDALVYLRHIRGIHQTVYKMDDQVVQTITGSPQYIGRIALERNL